MGKAMYNMEPKCSYVLFLIKVVQSTLPYMAPLQVIAVISTINQSGFGIRWEFAVPVEQ